MRQRRFTNNLIWDTHIEGIEAADDEEKIYTGVNGQAAAGYYRCKALPCALVSDDDELGWDGAWMTGSKTQPMTNDLTFGADMKLEL